jgi:ZIP family zinc transporter
VQLLDLRLKLLAQRTVANDVADKIYSAARKFGASVDEITETFERDEPADARAHHQVGTAGALGLSAQSFVDRLAVGFAFGADTATGVLVLVAVLSHDFADGLNTVSFVLNPSQDRGHALRWLLIDAVAPLFGATVGVLINVSEATLGHLLSFYAGFFLYMGATDLLPAAHEHASWGRVGLTLLGFAAIFGISLLAA